MYSADQIPGGAPLLDEAKAFRKLLSLTQDSVALIDRQFRYLYANKAHCDSLGVTSGQLLGNTSRDILGAEVFDRVLRPKLTQCLTGEQVSFAAWFDLAEGKRYRDVTFTPYVDDDGQISGVAVFTRDLTEKREAEKQLEAERGRLFNLLDGLPAFVFLQDSRHRVHFANSYYCERFGHWEGRHCYEVMQGIPSPCEDCPVDDIFSMEQATVCERRFPDGRYYKVYLYPFRDVDGTLLALTMGIDITQNRMAEEEIRRSLQEKEILLKEIHHRVKNNLQIISSLLFLQSETLDDDAAARFLRDSRTRIKSMALVHEFLYNSREFSSLDFHRYIEQLTVYVMQSYRSNPAPTGETGGATADVALSFDVAPVELSLDAAIPCGLIVNELVSNAMKYAFEGAQPEHGGRLRVGLTRNEDVVTLWVEDDGVGRPEMLDPAKHHSLGMQIVQSLAAQLGGEVHALPTTLPPRSADDPTGVRMQVTFSV